MNRHMLNSINKIFEEGKQSGRKMAVADCILFVVLANWNKGHTVPSKNGNFKNDFWENVFL